MNTSENHHRKRAGVGALAVLALVVTAARGGTADRPAAEEALERLKAGNARFASDASAGQPIGAKRRGELVAGQEPYAIVLSCADSRVPPEVVFNTGLGDLFVVRAAGHVADRSVLASVEYAAEHLHIPLLVVMGHESCGAVKATIDTKASLGPNLDYLIKAIKPAVEGTRTPSEKEWLAAAILANVEQGINDTLTKSPIVRHLVETSALMIVGGYYELSSGRVRFSQPVTVPAAKLTKNTGGH